MIETRDINLGNFEQMLDGFSISPDAVHKFRRVFERDIQPIILKESSLKPKKQEEQNYFTGKSGPFFSSLENLMKSYYLVNTAVNTFFLEQIAKLGETGAKEGDSSELVQNLILHANMLKKYVPLLRSSLSSCNNPRQHLVTALLSTKDYFWRAESNRMRYPEILRANPTEEVELKVNSAKDYLPALHEITGAVAEHFHDVMLSAANTLVADDRADHINLSDIVNFYVMHKDFLGKVIGGRDHELGPAQHNNNLGKGYFYFMNLFLKDEQPWEKDREFIGELIPLFEIALKDKMANSPCGNEDVLFSRLQYVIVEFREKGWESARQLAKVYTAIPRCTYGVNKAVAEIFRTGRFLSSEEVHAVDAELREVVGETPYYS